MKVEGIEEVRMEDLKNGGVEGVEGVKLKKLRELRGRHDLKVLET